MTACRKWRDRLLERALGLAAEPELEAHLKACPACAAALEEWRARRQQLDLGVRELVQGAEPSPAFRARVLASLEAAPAAPLAPPAWVGMLAAVAVLVLAALLLPRPAARLDPGPRPVALSEWRSPTDWLLRTPGHDLLRARPRFGDFYFPLESARPEKSNGGNDEG